MPFEKNIFINCPLDDEYISLLRPLLFTVVYLGFNPRLASETSDSSESRLDKICQLIAESKFSIHDLSRLRAEKERELFRMNMPFELGIDFGARRYGAPPLDVKKHLVLEKDRYEFQRTLSDLSGSDIKHHNNEPEDVVRAVRNWCVETAGLKNISSPNSLWNKFTEFAAAFYDARKAEGFSKKDLDMMPLPEYVLFIQNWTAAETE